jgi:phenylalanyl-tRNA synthetase alpha chain
MSAPNKSYDPVEVSVLRPEEVARLRDEALAAISATRTIEELKQVRLAHAGDRSGLALANREIGALPPAARADAGKRIGAARAAVEKAIRVRQVELEDERDERAISEETVDVTLPWDRRPVGGRHPLTTMQERMADVFVSMGFEIAEGPEVEAEWLNFDALNIPPDHPARSMQDTLWIEAPDGSDESGLVLRTHTSPVQLRALLSRELPVYVVGTGKTFRSDEFDATHSPVFHQMEGLAVDEGITMADLRGAIEAFVVGMFGEGLRTRFRPSYFPFTEPSAEVDMLCFACRGGPEKSRGCRACQGAGWIELGGCGMVNPRVLIAGGVDPDRYSGWAFGLGVERTFMFQHEAKDMRDMVEGDVRLTRAFGMEI